MIKHIVMFKLKASEGKTVMENARDAKEKAEKLKGLIPSLVNMEVVLNSEQTPESNYEIALICDFKDVEGLNAYQTHPEHLKFGAFIGTIRESRACIDYEY